MTDKETLPAVTVTPELEQLRAFVRRACEDLGAAAAAGLSAPPGLLGEAERLRRGFDPVLLRDPWRGLGHFSPAEGVSAQRLARVAGRHGSKCPPVPWSAPRAAVSLTQS